MSTAAQANTDALVALLERWKYLEDRKKGKPETTVLSYVQAALRQECEAVAATPVGTGLNERLAASAFSVGTLVQPGGLSYAEAFDALYGAAKSAGANDPPKDKGVIDRQLREGMKRPRDLHTLNGHAKKAGGRTLKLPVEPAEPLPCVPHVKTEPFPLDVLPPLARRFVEEGAASLSCPPDYLAVPLLVAAGSAIGASRALRMTRDWWVFPVVYAAVVAPPGSAKSPAAGRPLAAVKHQQLTNYRTFKTEREAWQKAPSDKRPADPPVFQRTYTTDVTVEKLASLLRDGPRGLLLHRDELVAWIASFNQYRDGGKGADQQVFMTIWDHQAFSIERKAHDDGLPITVHRPCLSVFGTIQPDVVPHLTRPDERDGFLERILFSYAEPSTSMRRWDWEGISEQASHAWRELVGRLYSLEMAPPIEEGNDPWPRFVEFAPAARPAWEQWYAGHQRVKRDLPESMHPCHAKLENYCGRLSLLIELLWYASDGSSFDPTSSPDVSPQAVECAARLVAYFLNHARRVYGCLEHTTQDRRIDQVVAWIRKRGGAVTPRDLLQYRVGGVKTASAAVRLIEELTDRALGTALVEKNPANGKDVVKFNLFDQQPSSADSADPAPTGQSALDRHWIGAG